MSYCLSARVFRKFTFSERHNSFPAGWKVDAELPVALVKEGDSVQSGMDVEWSTNKGCVRSSIPISVILPRSFG
ncbi:hypothetical protein KY285_024592 [Solanum tuberosum]|nr:hypothetical protein KY285_024592 [Solanum tuberosum]